MKDPAAAVFVKIATVSVPTARSSGSPVVAIATGSSAGTSIEPETDSEVSPRLFLSDSDQSNVAPGVTGTSKVKSSPVASPWAATRTMPPLVRRTSAVDAPSPAHSTVPEKVAVVASLSVAVTPARTGSSSGAAAKRRISVPEPPRPPKQLCQRWGPPWMNHARPPPPPPPRPSAPSRPGSGV